MYQEIREIISLMNFDLIHQERKTTLLKLATYIQNKLTNNQSVDIIFICTHNSRRSQIAQAWCSVFASEGNLNIEAFSGGTEKTAVAPQVIAALQNFGFKVNQNTSSHDIKNLVFADDAPNISLHSKVFTNPENPQNDFIAAMTCSDADANCPIVNGCSHRAALTYHDPKLFDNTTLETTMYQNIVFKIGCELRYLFSQIQKK